MKIFVHLISRCSCMKPVKNGSAISDDGTYDPQA